MIDLLRRGVSLELFLEGTRSRTGKTMRPKLGLASMATDAWRFGSHDIHFVPVSVDYDRVIEVSSYARELAGAEKRSESMAGLLGAIRVLGSRYGSVRLQFGDPISLAALARTRGLPRDPSPKHDGVWRAEVEKLCSHILRRAAEMSLVTPAAIAATALLGRGETIRESAFLDRCRGIVEYLQGAGTRLAETLLDRTTQLSTLLEATTRFVEDGAVAVEVPTRVGGQRLYRVLGEHRIALDFYKNSAMTHVAGAAIVCRALARNGGEATHPDLSDAGRFLFGLFRREFSHCDDEGDPQARFDEQLRVLASRAFLTVRDDGRIVAGKGAPMALLAETLDCFVEAYWLMASTLTSLRRDALRHRDVIRIAVDRARHGEVDGRVTRLECANHTLMQSAADWMLASGVIEAHIEGGERLLRLTPEYDRGRLEDLIERIATFL